MPNILYCIAYKVIHVNKLVLELLMTTNIKRLIIYYLKSGVFGHFLFILTLARYFFDIPPNNQLFDNVNFHRIVIIFSIYFWTYFLQVYSLLGQIFSSFDENFTIL